MKRAKFRAGQIVAFNGRWVRIASDDADGDYYCDGDPREKWGHESEFKALSARDIEGPRPKVKK